jgi:hypothetical protein
MSEVNARRNLYTMLRFDMKGFIDPDSIKRNALTRVDVTIAGCITPLKARDHSSSALTDGLNSEQR